MENINSVELVGYISNIYHRDQFLSVTIGVNRPGVIPAGEKVTRNYPRVMWYGDDADAIADKFKNGDRVKITGYIDTSRPVRGENNKTYRQQQLIGKTIETAKSNLEELFGMVPTISNFAPNENNVILKGVVTRTYSPPNAKFAIAVLRVIKDNIFSFPEVYFFGRAAEYIRTSVKEYDTLCITGTIQTYRKIGDDGKFEYRENIVCSEIAVQSNNEPKEEPQEQTD